MLADRPYRKGIAMNELIDELKKESGRQFDPAVVDTFLKLQK
jgi:HD-GYP domain-containing protein (c-di-GMP phosphodiesterase class II)